MPAKYVRAYSDNIMHMILTISKIIVILSED